VVFEDFACFESLKLGLERENMGFNQPLHELLFQQASKKHTEIPMYLKKIVSL